MLQKLGDHVASCLARATDAEQRAAAASSEAVRLDNEKIARSWRHLARSYQFVESLERFLLDAETAKAVRPPGPRSAVEFLPPGFVFDPDDIPVLISVYNKAIEGRPASDHEKIAKRIIFAISRQR